MTFPTFVEARSTASSSRYYVAEHARCFGRHQTVYDPWHYLPVLARKPGALRNAEPFRD